MVNYGLVVVVFFFSVDIFECCFGICNLDELGGIVKQVLKFVFWFVVIVFVFVLVLFMLGFIGEFLFLKGFYSYNWFIGIIVGMMLILGVVYIFCVYQRSMYGEVKVVLFFDFYWSEWMVFFLFIVVIVVFGVVLQFVIGYVELFVKNFIEFI